MPTPWLSWPRKLASTRCSATIEASAGVLPPAATIRVANASSLAWSMIMLPPLSGTHRIWERCWQMPPAKGHPQTWELTSRFLGSAAGAGLQRRVERLVIFLLEATDQFGRGQDLTEAADALPRAPDFLPGLRL